MARKVKCQATGEYGTNDVFIKIKDKYYKDRDTYEKFRKEKEMWNEILQYICVTLLNYQGKQPVPPLVTHKLKGLEYYSREVILQAFQEKEKDILYQINQDGKFKDEQGKIFYMFAIITNTINDVNKRWKRKQLTQVKQEQSEIDIGEDISVVIENLGTSKKGKNISNWLEDDEK